MFIAALGSVSNDDDIAFGTFTVEVTTGSAMGGDAEERTDLELAEHKFCNLATPPPRNFTLSTSKTNAPLRTSTLFTPT